MTQRAGQGDEIRDIINSLAKEDSLGPRHHLSQEEVEDFYEEEEALAREEMIKPTITVGENHTFPWSRWREAILFFLNGVWRGDINPNAPVWPRIRFANDRRVELVSRGDYYNVYGTARQTSLGECSTGEWLELTNSRAGVENGLVRFVRNNRIRQLRINLSVRTQLRLTKHVERTKLTVELVGV